MASGGFDIKSLLKLFKSKIVFKSHGIGEHEHGGSSGDQLGCAFAVVFPSGTILISWFVTSVDECAGHSLPLFTIVHLSGDFGANDIVHGSLNFIFDPLVVQLGKNVVCQAIVSNRAIDWLPFIRGWGCPSGGRPWNYCSPSWKLLALLAAKYIR